MGFSRGFDVCRHPVRGYRAIKRGFSWPGFFFSFIWALLKGLWGVAFAVLGVNVALKLMENAAAEALPGLAWLVVLAGRAWASSSACTATTGGGSGPSPRGSN